MIHLNGHMMVAIDTETTGTNPEIHEIIQIACIPLGFDLKPSEKHMPFEMHIRPDFPDDIDPDALKVSRKTMVEVMNRGVASHTAASLLVEWFEGLKLPNDKRLVPLAKNWYFDVAFMVKWLGPKNYHYIFDGRVRDLQTAALFMNDRADFKAEKVPFPKADLGSIAGRVGVDYERLDLHDALQDARITAEAYRKLLGYGALL
jgi:DNA polymerase III epsilon subunit-like protein